MADNNYDINPVRNLQNVVGLTPAGQRERKKQRQSSKQKKGHPMELNQPTQEEEVGDTLTAAENEEHLIDYRA